MSMLIVLFVIFVDFVNGCQERVEMADECAKRVTIFGNPDALIPVSDSEMDIHCNSSFASINCLREFGRQCLPLFPRQALGIFTRSLRKNILKRCKQQQYRTEFLKFAKCWTPKERLHKINICVDKQIIQLEYINKRVDPEYQIPGICCTFQQKNDCIRKEMSEICDESHVNYTMKMIEDATGQLARFACSRYVSVEACDRHYEPKVWIPIKDLVNTENEELLEARHKYHSILAPIFEIVTQFNLDNLNN